MHVLESGVKISQLLNVVHRSACIQRRSCEFPKSRQYLFGSGACVLCQI